MQTITGLNDPNVAVADISGAYTVQGTSHIWCSDDPWAYGLSIYSVTSPSSFESQAPFHPTPDGQESIAEHVIPVVRQWFQPNRRRRRRRRPADHGSRPDDLEPRSRRPLSRRGSDDHRLTSTRSV